jgi:hypothetical protein
MSQLKIWNTNYLKLLKYTQNLQQLLPLGKHRCGKSKKCEYLITYGDDSYSFGELSTDSISFGEQ